MAAGAVTSAAGFRGVHGDRWDDDGSYHCEELPRRAGPGLAALKVIANLETAQVKLPSDSRALRLNLIIPTGSLTFAIMLEG